MELVKSIVWIFLNIAFPILPIAIVYLRLKLIYTESKHLKIYQFIARHDGLTLYASLLSIVSLLQPIFYLLSEPNLLGSLSKQKQNSLIFLIIFLIFVFILTFSFYCFLLDRNIDIESLYSDKNEFDDEQERMLALTIVALTISAISGSFMVKLINLG
ncbi:MAG: hypothetical protein AAFQ14_08180 [Cyanobacteria bacterium J06621_12]